MLSKVLVLVGFSVALSLQIKQEVTPVQKVIDLLGQISDQIAKEGATEAAEYDKFACFCKEQADDKQYAIEKSDAKIKDLTAEIDSLEADISELNEEITDLSTRIEELGTKIENETEHSAAAKKLYVTQADNLTTAISQAEQAIEMLKNSKDELKGDVKLNLAELSRTMSKALPNINSSTFALIDRLAQKPAQYTYSSNDIISVIEELADTFREEKKDLDQTEITRAGASASRLLAYNNEKDFKTKAKEEKEVTVGEKTEAKSAAEADRTAETTARDADADFMAEMTTTCEGKATEWDQRSKARSDELTAISEATNALKTGVESNYAANKKLAGLQRTSKVTKGGFKLKNAPALIQISEHTAAAATRRALDSLSTAADNLHSPVLAAIAAKVSLTGDFTAVKSLISDLISKLEAEATDEATQKDFCGTELQKGVTNRDGQSLDIEKQTATIEKKGAEIAQLTEEIATLSEEIAGLQKALSEAAQLRAEESASNTKTLSEAEEGKKAVEFAITVLNDFYGTSALQVSGEPLAGAPGADRSGKTVADLAPEPSYSGDYNGKTEQGGGVIAILGMIAEDFERTLTQVGEAETQAVTDHTTFETDSNADIKAKSADKTTKEEDVVAANEAIVTAKSALKDSAALHESALKELERLQAICVEGEESFEERKAQREKEIEALKGALEILESWDK